MRRCSGRRGWIGIGAAMAMTLAACSPATQVASPSAPTTPSLVPAGEAVSAAVRVVPSRSSDLGFLISAPVRELLVDDGDQVEAGQALIALDAPDLELAVEAAEQALLAAERNEFIQSQGRRKWDGFKFVWVAGPPEQRTAAHARVLQAQAGLEAAEAELEQAILRAPFAGTIVSIAVQPGEVVRPGQVVASVGDLAQLQIETTDLSEREIARVHTGQPAQVTLDALPEQLSGLVTAIDLIAGRSADGDVTYTVTIELTAQPQDLLWGMTGIAKIQFS